MRTISNFMPWSVRWADDSTVYSRKLSTWWLNHLLKEMGGVTQKQCDRARWAMLAEGWDFY